MTVSPEPLLELRDWSLARHTPQGTRPVLRNVDLDIRPGQWLAVLGTNGSGKSSLLKFLASDDSPLADRAGIMFQDPDDQLFAASVERELGLGRPEGRASGSLTEFGLEGLESVDPRLLSAGQKQRLVLAVALGLEPRLLLCDEPTALQDPAQSLWVLDRLEQWLATTGGALVTATCDRNEAARSDWLVLLDGGRILRQGPTTDLIDAPEVENLLGPPVEAVGNNEPVAAGSGRTLLEVRGLDCRFGDSDRGLRNVDLVVRAGEIVGITGPNGCGKSTLLAACAGARKPDTGTISLAGRMLYEDKSPDLAHGAAMLAPQFPEYLFTRSTVADEIRLDPVLAAGDPDSLLAELGLPAEVAQRNPHDLSTGQRRRLALGLVLRSERPVLLLDEPTAALDRKGRQLVLDLLAVVPPGATVVIASHDTGFLRAAGCRLQVLEAGGLAPGAKLPT
jgi:energy-coupling factor transport system ATP-binding protein